MKLYAFNGQLYAETGELVEGVMSCQTSFHPDGHGGITEVQFTVLLETMPLPAIEDHTGTVLGLHKLLASLSEDE